MTTSALSLSKLLQAANVLAGQTKPDNVPIKSSTKPGLADVLAQRLASISSVIESFNILQAAKVEWETLQESSLKRWTGKIALALLLRLQQFELDEVEKRASASTVAESSKAAQQPLPPLFGMRDIKTLQILSSLVARWGLANAIDQGVLPSEMQERVPTMQLIELEEEDSLANLADLTRDCCTLLLRKTQALGSKGEIQTIVLPHLLLPTLAGLLQLESSGVNSKASPIELLDSVNPSTAMAALFTLLSAKSTGKGGIKPAWLNPAVSSLLSRQIARPGGILGLLNVMLGRAEQELQFSQLEQIAKLVTTPPKGTSVEDHLSAVLPRILGILRPPNSGNAPPPAFVRALCFCISTLISSSPDLLQDKLSPYLSMQGDDIEGQIELLSVITANIDPSPTVYATLFSPIISKLFSMLFFLLETRGDPVLREAINSLISVWARVLTPSELVQGISRVVDECPQFKWERSDTGGIRSKIESDDAREPVEDMEIQPNPDSVVDWLKQHNRSQATTSLLVLWLDQVNVLRQEPEQDGNFRLQKMIILRLQLMLKIIEECGSDIVKEATQTLQFINLALEDAPVHTKKTAAPNTRLSQSLNASGTGLSLNDLKIVDNDQDDMEDSVGDEVLEEEAEFPELLGIAPSEQLQVTGLTLLLALLEGHDDLTVENTPALRSISSKLSKLEEAATETTARLAKDANFILSLRSASTRATTSSGEGPDDPLRASRETYQEALKLLQDPILPVRAQGLSILRSLVDSKDALLKTDTALIPAILDIFVHAVQDDDSFIYLSAVQGLSGMVDQFGKDILRRLVSLYTGNDPDSVGSGEKGVKELDGRLRVGEAMIQVIQRADKSLPILADILVPALLHIIRTSSLPVALRASAITVLATCAEASPLALLPHLESLADAMLDLLSLESRQKVQVKPKDETPDGLATASTHPSLRRSALLLLGLLLRAAPEQVSPRMLARMKAVLGYLHQTDEDPLVRHNAGEVLEDCNDLQ